MRALWNIVDSKVVRVALRFDEGQGRIVTAIPDALQYGCVKRPKLVRYSTKAMGIAHLRDRHR